MAIITNKNDLQKLRKSAKVLTKVLDMLAINTRAGITGAELNNMAEQMIQDSGMKPSFKGYQGFPAAVCVSIEEQVVHAIPGNRKLHTGEIVSYDCGIWCDDVCTDACITVPVGEVSAKHIAIMRANYIGLMAGISKIKPKATVGDIGSIIEATVENHGFHIIRELTGHGVGYAIHEKPYIYNFGEKGQGKKLLENMVLAIEPIVSENTTKYKTDSQDGWSTYMPDGSLSCQYEHTILITKNGCEILTETDFVKKANWLK